jgi:ribonuclease D
MLSSSVVELMATSKDSAKLISSFFIRLRSGTFLFRKFRFILISVSFFDLRQIIPATNYQNGGLANLTRQILGRKLNKDYRVRCSNWEAETLSNEQKTYAADDAVCALQVRTR